MERAEFEDFRRRLEKTDERLFWGLPFGAAAFGFGVAEVWSTISGVVVAALILVVGWEIVWRSTSRRRKSRWIRRFPELADPRHWRDSG